MTDPVSSAAAEEAVGAAAGAIASAGANISGALRTEFEKARVSILAGFEGFFERQRIRLGFTKTLLYKDAAVPISDFYVRTRLEHKDAIYEDAEFLKLTNERPQILIMATAGSGKSIFLKHLFLRSLSETGGRIPIFVELRDLNDWGGKPLIEMVRMQVQDAIPSLPPRLFEFLLKAGKLTLFLDAFDEIDPALRATYEKEVVRLSKKYLDLKIFVTTRPDESFMTWQRFHVYKMLPLSKAQAVELIQKLKYNVAVKEKFSQELEASLYETHEEFVSNPLLLTIMLMTFEDVGAVPDRMYLFYEEAFKVLFQRHDAAKEVFRRITYSGLKIDKFRSVLAAFCAITYARSQFHFDDDKVTEAISRAMGLTKVAAETDAYLKDLLLSVCILLRDGLQITFSHRSFQEYFCAVFWMAKGGQELSNAIEQLVARGGSANVIGMMYEMNPDLLEQVWIGPALRQYKEKISKADPSKDLGKHLQAVGIKGLSVRVWESNERFAGFGFDVPPTSMSCCRFHGHLV